MKKELYNESIEEQEEDVQILVKPFPRSLKNKFAAACRMDGKGKTMREVWIELAERYVKEQDVKHQILHEGSKI